MGWVDRQLPKGDETFLDHLGFFVPDIEGVAAAFERIGFLVTPVNIHSHVGPDGAPVRSGTANRLVVLRRGYLEVLAAVADTPLAEQLACALRRYQGLHLLAFTHPDAAGQEARIRQAGFELQSTVRLRRPVQTPAGDRTLHVTVLRAAPGVFPEGRVQMLTHETPELIWQPDSLRHPNRADALTDVLLVSGDARDKAARFARFTGGAAGPEGEGWVVSLARGRMTFAPPEAAARLLPRFAPPSLPYTAAVAIASADLDETRRLLASRGIRPLADAPEALCLGPEDGIGAYLVFHREGVAPVWPRLGV